MRIPNPPTREMRASNNVIIEHADAVLPDRVVSDATVCIRGGRIASMDAKGGDRPSNAEIVDGRGLLLVPGFIDLHSDAIEKEIRPRPGGNFPLAVALTELDKRLAACGVTTMYHCLCFGESETNELRTAKAASEIARNLQMMEPHLTVRNRIHVRFEVTDTGSVPELRDLLRCDAVDLFSLMDHTPGQGQFTDLEHFKTYYGQAEHLTGDQAAELANHRMRTRATVGDGHIRELTALCTARGIPMASHDDDTAAKVKWVHDMGVTISEFPVRMDAAQTARKQRMQVLMGAPNVLRGGSLTGNLGGEEAIRAGCCTLLGSDYSPMSLLHAVFALAENKCLSLHESFGLITRNPARALGMGDEFGTLSPGAIADLVLIDTAGPVPRIVRTMVGGRTVFAAPPCMESGLSGEGEPAYDACACNAIDAR